MKTCPCLKSLKRTKTVRKLLRFSHLFAFTVCARLTKPKWNKKVKYIPNNARENRQDPHGSDKTTNTFLLYKILRYKGLQQRLPKIVQVGLILIWLTHQLGRHKKRTSKSLAFYNGQFFHKEQKATQHERPS